MPVKRRLYRAARSLLEYLRTPGGPFFIALLLLAGGATWFAANSTINYRQAKQWAGESRAWQERALETERLLRRSEADVEDLQARQIALAEEKSVSEDLQGFAEMETSRAIIAGAYQARCAEALIDLIRREANDPAWARRNRPLVFSYCREAERLWQADGEPGGKPSGSGRK